MTLRLALVALLAALIGSAGGAALLALPPLLWQRAPDSSFQLVEAIFVVSLPFALAGAAILSALSVLWRRSLTGEPSGYGVLIVVALPLGALMPLPFFGMGGLFFGLLFAAITALAWAALHRLAFHHFSRDRDYRHG